MRLKETTLKYNKLLPEVEELQEWKGEAEEVIESLRGGASNTLMTLSSDHDDRNVLQEDIAEYNMGDAPSYYI